MSHSHIRVPKPVQRFRPWSAILMGAVAVVLVALFGLGRVIEWPSKTDHSTTTGQVLETRIVVDHLRYNSYGGLIYYRIDAHVSYQIQGQQQDRWMTASETTTEREVLAVKLSSHPKTCLVYWFPKHPENAQCRLQ